MPRRVYDRDVGMLTDLVRCTLMCKDIASVHRVLRKVLAKSAIGMSDNMLGNFYDGRRKMLLRRLTNRLDPEHSKSNTHAYR